MGGTLCFEKTIGYFNIHLDEELDTFYVETNSSSFLENKTWLPGKSDDSLVYGQIFKYWNVPNRSYVLALFVVICHEIDMFFSASIIVFCLGESLLITS